MQECSIHLDQITTVVLVATMATTLTVLSNVVVLTLNYTVVLALNCTVVLTKNCTVVLTLNCIVVLLLNSTVVLTLNNTVVLTPNCTVVLTVALSFSSVFILSCRAFKLSSLPVELFDSGLEYLGASVSSSSTVCSRIWPKYILHQ